MAAKTPSAAGRARAGKGIRSKLSILRQIPEFRATIWLFVILVLAAIALNFLRKESVEFSLYATTEALSFSSAKEVSSELVTIRSAQLHPADRLTIDDEPVSLAPGKQIDLSEADDVLTLSSIIIPKQWTISVEVAAKDPKHLKLIAAPKPTATSFGLAKLSFVAGHKTSIAFQSAGHGLVTKSLLEGTDVVIETNSISISLEGGNATLFDHVDFDNVSLTRDRHTTDDAGHDILALEGAAISGSLWRDYASPEQIAIGRLDQLTVRAVRDGMLREVVWKDGVLTAAAHGEAGELSDQLGQTKRDLRPVWLTVIKDAGIFQIILGIFTFVGGLQLSAFVRSRKE